MQPQRTLQPPNLPPQNRTIFIRPQPTRPSIQVSANLTHHESVNNSKHQLPSFSQTSSSYSPYIPIYLRPEEVTEPSSSSSKPTPMHIQRIPAKGHSASKTSWPPPFSTSDVNKGRFPDVDNTKPEGYSEEVEEVTPVIQSRSKLWKTTNFCRDDQFECGVRDCIPLTWVCNGQQVM